MRRVVATLAGAALIVALLRFLPEDVLRVTTTTLYLAAALILLLVSAALFVAPARRLLSAIFVLGLRVPAAALFSSVPEADQRRTLAPLVVAAICAGVAALAGALR